MPPPPIPARRSITRVQVGYAIALAFRKVPGALGPTPRGQVEFWPAAAREFKTRGEAQQALARLLIRGAIRPDHAPRIVRHVRATVDWYSPLGEKSSHLI